MRIITAFSAGSANACEPPRSTAPSTRSRLQHSTRLPTSPVPTVLSTAAECRSAPVLPASTVPVSLQHNSCLKPKNTQMNKKIRQNILPLLGSLLGILLLWEVAAILLGRYFLPQPTEVAFTTGRLFADGKILAHILASLRRITFGTAAGLGAALPVGILMGRIPAADRILGAFFRFLYPVPKVVFMPIVVVMLGIGDAAKIFLIFLAVFFQMTIIIRDSAASLEQELTDVMRSMNADRAAVLRHLVLPGILPGILTALKASLGTSVALLMITELFASTSGLGYFIMNSMDSRDYPQMYAGIVILALMSAVLYGVLEAAESILCKWHYVRRG